MKQKNDMNQNILFAVVFVFALAIVMLAGSLFGFTADIGLTQFRMDSADHVSLYLALGLLGIAAAYIAF